MQESKTQLWGGDGVREKCTESYDPSHPFMSSWPSHFLHVLQYWQVFRCSMEWISFVSLLYLSKHLEQLSAGHTFSQI